MTSSAICFFKQQGWRRGSNVVGLGASSGACVFLVFDGIACEAVNQWQALCAHHQCYVALVISGPMSSSSAQI